MKSIVSMNLRFPQDYIQKTDDSYAFYFGFLDSTLNNPVQVSPQILAIRLGVQKAFEAQAKHMDSLSGLGESFSQPFSVIGTTKDKHFLEDRHFKSVPVGSSTPSEPNETTFPNEASQSIIGPQNRVKTTTQIHVVIGTAACDKTLANSLDGKAIIQIARLMREVQHLEEDDTISNLTPSIARKADAAVKSIRDGVQGSIAAHLDKGEKMSRGEADALRKLCADAEEWIGTDLLKMTVGEYLRRRFS